jgi:hypothetical protein
MLLSAERNYPDPVWDALSLCTELVADSSELILYQPATAGHSHRHFLTDARSKKALCAHPAAL